MLAIWYVKRQAVQQPMRLVS